MVTVEFINHPKIKPETIQARIYQQVLFTEAVKQNTLIILPTGLGKTIVMIMLIAHYLKNQNGKIIIIAPTRPLVDQHQETLVDKLDILEDDVVIMSGSLSPNKRSAMWDKSSVFVTTPQTLRNDIVAGRCSLVDVSLICFDEAHKAVGDDPYVLIAEQYNLKNNLGRIVGFTASPKNREKLLEVVKNLSITSIKHMTEDDPRIQPYIHGSDQEIIFVNPPAQMLDLLELLHRSTKNHLTQLKQLEMVKSIQPNKLHKKSLVTLPAKLNANRENMGDTEFFKSMKAYGQLMLITQGSEMLETQGIHTLSAFLKNKRDELTRSGKTSLKSFFKDQNIIELEKRIKNLEKGSIENPKLSVLLKIVSEVLLNSSGSKIMIFSNYKATVNYLVTELNKLEKAKAHMFVGQASSSYGKGLKQKDQKIVMERFKSGDFNILVSTSVGEEGLDVAQCDLVAFYDITPSSTRLIQRAGRTGRSRKGRVVLLVMKGTRDEAYYYISTRKKNELPETVKSVIEEINLSEGEDVSNLDTFFDATSSNSNENLDRTIPSKAQDDILDLIIDFDENQTNPKIYIDHREKGSLLLRELMKRDIELIQADLPIGDFILSERVGVERKTVSDFCKSVIDQRLFTQLKELKRTYKTPILILEHSSSNCNLSKAAFNGAIVSVIIDFNIPIYSTKDQIETIDFLYSIAKREQLRGEKSAKIRVSNEESSLADEQIGILSSMPNINGILADKLLHHFKTLKDVINAHPDELRNVHGIGRNIANRLDVLFSSPYENDDLFD